MPVPTFRAPGVRWPIPNFLTCLAIAGFGFGAWAIFTAVEEDQRLQALFQPDASNAERVQAAESWAKKGAEGLPRLKEALASADGKTRYLGLLGLAYLPRQHARLALPEVIRLCDDPEPKVQADALILAATLSESPEQIAPLVASRLLSPEPKLVNAAQAALQNIGPPAVPAIAAVYRETEPNIQANCLYLLSSSVFDDQFGPLACSVISECLRSPHAYVRLTAYQLASAIRPLDSQEVSLGLRDSELAIVKLALKEWTGNADREPAELPQLLRLLRERRELRITILEAIAARAPVAADLFPEILPETESEDPAVRAPALAALVRVTGDAERVRPVLLQRVLDADAQVARQAARLLAETAPQDLPEIVRSLLMPRIHSPEESVQVAAVAALSEMPHAAVSERLALIRLLSRESAESMVSPAVRYGLAEALGNMGPEARDAVPALLNLIHRTPVRDARLCIPVAALGRIGHIDPSVLKTLIALYEQPAPRKSPLKVALLEAFGRLGGDNAQVMDLVMDEALKCKSPRVRVAALRALSHLSVDPETALATYTFALKDENINVRIAACLLLGELGESEESVWTFARLLEDDMSLVRVVAARSLAGLGPAARGALPALINASQDRSNRFSHNLTDWDEEDEGGKVEWDLFDGSLQALNRSSVSAAVESALAAIQNRDRGVKTALLERED